MFVGACGFGSTGSSVITDYLKEFDNNCVLDKGEFTIATSTDGLIDLEYHLMHPHSRVVDSACALERFRYMIIKKRGPYLAKKMGITISELTKLTDDFIDEITQVSWLNYQNYTNSFWKEQFGGRVLFYKIIPFLEKRMNITYKGYPMSKTRLSVHPINFYEAAQHYMHIMLEYMGADFSKNIVMDQPFSGNNPVASFPFFEDPVAIIVDRDPRDNYVFAKTKLKGNNNRFMPTDNVYDFIKYYRALRDGQPYKEKDKRVLCIQFEELVYDYDVATQKVRDFLKLPENPAPKSIFDPSLSIANTQTFKRFPEYAQDVAIIEKELKEYLFDFSKYPDPDLSGEMFFGKSPLNR